MLPEDDVFEAHAAVVTFSTLREAVGAFRKGEIGSLRCVQTAKHPANSAFCAP